MHIHYTNTVLLHSQSLYDSDFLPGNFYRLGTSLGFWRLFQAMAENWEKCRRSLSKSQLLKLPKTALSIFTCNCRSKKLHKRCIKGVIEACKLWNSQRKKCMLSKTINRMFLSCKIHRTGSQCAPAAFRGFFIGIKGECASSSSSSLILYGNFDFCLKKSCSASKTPVRLGMLPQQSTGC